MRKCLIAYWVVSAVVSLLAIFNGYPSIAAYCAVLVGLPWNILVGMTLPIAIVAISLTLEAVGVGRIDLSHTTGNQQVLFVIVLGAILGVLLNSFIVNRHLRRREVGSIKVSRVVAEQSGEREPD
jgi:hypothetical protein